MKGREGRKERGTAGGIYLLKPKLIYSVPRGLKQRLILYRKNATKLTLNKLS